MKKKQAEAQKALADFREFTLSVSDVCGVFSNTQYPHQRVIRSGKEFADAIRHDHVCGKFKGGKRGIKNFLSADVVGLDVDNDNGDDASEWATPDDVMERFPDVPMVMAPSAHDMKEKKGQSPRRRFHVYFPIPEEADADAYAATKRRIYEAFPYFDKNALDAARVFRGIPVEESDVIIVDGSKDVIEFLDAEDAEARERAGKTPPVGPDEEALLSMVAGGGKTIPVGSRNGALHSYAVRLLKRLGDAGGAREKFDAMSERCEEPLPRAELESIWRSALKFYRETVATDGGYVPPDEYGGGPPEAEGWMFPEDDQTDMGEAAAFYAAHGGEIAYTDETGFMRYDGTRWVKGDKYAYGLAHRFLDEQLAEARKRVEESRDALVKAGIPRRLVEGSRKELEKVLEPRPMGAYKSLTRALAYLDFVLLRRNQRYIKWMMTVAASMALMDFEEFDDKWWLLNTPAGTYDLRKGLDGLRPHDPNDRITHITSASPGTEGEDVWRATLDRYFLGDQEMVDYMQVHMGETAFGAIFNERLSICVGEGANGKTSLFNALFLTLGSYAGKISADALVRTKKLHNFRPEVARLKGKRMVIISELGDDLALDMKMVKDLCSADARITGEYKYHNPFEFSPSHSLVLYCNRLPIVRERDKGTWRRLLVIPFDAEFPPEDATRRYGQRLAEEAGPAILGWLIEGAKKAYDSDFKYAVPAAISGAGEIYRKSMDWFEAFVEEHCDVYPGAEERAKRLADRFQSAVGGVSAKDFRDALEEAGFRKKRDSGGYKYEGIKIKDDPDGPPDEKG